MEKTQKTLMKRVEEARRGQRHSVRSIAPAAGITEGRWRQIAKGSMRSGGVEVPVTAPADTLARMVLAVDLTEADVADVAPDDVVKRLRGIMTQEEWHSQESARLADDESLEGQDSVSIYAGDVDVDLEDGQIDVRFRVADNGHLRRTLTSDDLVGAAFVARSSFLDEMERAVRIRSAEAGRRAQARVAEVREKMRQTAAVHVPPFPADVDVAADDVDEPGSTFPAHFRPAARAGRPHQAEDERTRQDASSEAGDEPGAEDGA